MAVQPTAQVSPLRQSSSSREAPVHDSGARRPSLLACFLPLFLLALALRIALAWSLVPDGLSDDGYITLRYAANLAEGRGFVYNPGEPVWGTTTPLLTLLLALCASAFGPAALEVSALAIGIAASLVFWIVTLVLFEQQKVPRIVSVPLLLLILFSPSYLGNSVSGMETPLVLALMALSLICYTKDRPVLLGLLCALLLLARIDTLIWIVVLGGGFLLRHLRTNRRAALGALAAFLAASVPWQLYAYRTFHSLIPQSLVGKAVSHEAFSALDWSYFVSFYHVYFPVLRLGSFAWLGILLTLALVLLGFRTLWTDYPLLRPLGVYFFCFTASFLGGKAPLFMWYFPPTQWIAFLLFCLGLTSVWDRLPGVAGNPAVRLAPIGMLTGVLMAFSAVAAYGLWRDGNPNGRWVAMSNFIGKYTPPDSRVFLEHIGLVGYKTGRPILDNMGLVSPEIISLKKRFPNDYRWLTVAVRTFTPDVVVLYQPQDPHQGTGVWSEEGRAWFDREYAPATEIKTTPASYVYFRAGLVP
jgi:hypothetical protein